MDGHSPSRLLILACSATKRDGPKYLPAIVRYDGPLWRTLRTVDPDGRLAKIAFLSAQFGRRPFAEVALVGGHLYLDVMREFVTLFRGGRYLTVDASIVEINGPIGRMRQDLRLWLLSTSGETG